MPAVTHVLLMSKDTQECGRDMSDGYSGMILRYVMDETLCSTKVLIEKKKKKDSIK